MSSRLQQSTGPSVASSSSAAAPPSPSNASSSTPSGLHPSRPPRGPRRSTQVSSQAQVQQIPPSTNPPTSTNHRSIFKFRERRGQWLTFVGLIAACVFGIPALKYAADSRALAVWEAEKDYQLYCQSLQVFLIPPSLCSHSGLIFPVVFQASSYGLCFHCLEDASTASISFTELLPEQFGEAEACLERCRTIYCAG